MQTSQAEKKYGRTHLQQCRGDAARNRARACYTNRAGGATRIGRGCYTNRARACCTNRAGQRGYAKGRTPRLSFWACGIVISSALKARYMLQPPAETAYIHVLHKLHGNTICRQYARQPEKIGHRKRNEIYRKAQR